MAPKKEATKATEKSQKTVTHNFEILSSQISALQDTVALINDRLTTAEATVARLAPRENLVPAEVWAKLGESAILGSAVQAGITAALTNVPLATIAKGALRANYADIALDMAETILVQAAKRMGRELAPTSPENNPFEEPCERLEE
ncbi:hypothetical protein CMI37_31455 [Candidatus Pacearchaeota archaeon]|nr:hypothetical protein [Candidatus Pacearchaeota archaeon]